MAADGDSSSIDLMIPVEGVRSFAMFPTAHLHGSPMAMRSICDQISLLNLSNKKPT